MGDANRDALFIALEPPVQRDEVAGNRVASVASPPCLVPGKKRVEGCAGGKLIGSQRRGLHSRSHHRHDTPRLLTASRASSSRRDWTIALNRAVAASLAAFPMRRRSAGSRS